MLKLFTLNEIRIITKKSFNQKTDRAYEKDEYASLCQLFRLMYVNVLDSEVFQVLAFVSSMISF